MGITRMRKVLSERDQGFSLAELVVAMLVIAVILILLVGVQISALTSTAEARRLQQATAFANQAMEQLRAIPWNVLNVGMHTSYATWGDSHVVGGNLVVDGQSAPLRQRGPQNASQPWAPLFDSTGSHIHTRQDASLTGAEFTIKAYALEGGLDGTHAETVGLAVIVEWEGRNGPAHTVLWSTVARDEGCGNPATRPFLAACQAVFEANATTGAVLTTVTARSVTDVDNPDPQPWPLLGPGYGAFYSMSVRTASAGATVNSQQVTIATSVLQYGGSVVDDHPDNTGTQPSIEGWINGHNFYELDASDDITPNAPPPNPTDVLVAHSGTAEQERSLSASGSPIASLRGRSDVRRPGTADASVTVSCQSGIPAEQPCARSHLANFADINEGSGYVVMDVQGTTFRLARRLSETAHNTEYAWAARFISAAGTLPEVGCLVLVDAGCVSAGAQRTMGTLSIGAVATGSGGWNGQATEGLLLIRGRSGCANGFEESVMVQRGPNQVGEVPAFTRCGQLRYWNGAGYTNLNITNTTSQFIDIPTVTWSHSNHTIQASAQVQISAPTYTVEGTDPDCQLEACAITGRSGGIAIFAQYTITRHSQPQVTYIVEATTMVDPPEATASYRSDPND